MFSTTITTPDSVRFIFIVKLLFITRKQCTYYYDKMIELPKLIFVKFTNLKCFDIMTDV